jgi:hypothetical protein
MPIYTGLSTKNKQEIWVGGKSIGKVYVGDKLVWQKVTTQVGLKLTWDNIVNIPVADASSVSDWNTFFDLPTFGNPFTSVVVIGNEVDLIGGSNITLKNFLFERVRIQPAMLTTITDTLGMITHIGIAVFDEKSWGSGFVSGIFAGALTCGNYCFNECKKLSVVSIPSLLNLGTTTGDDGVFIDVGISGSQNITLTIPAALMTCNGGNPDGDIQYLQANNTVTIVQV